MAVVADSGDMTTYPQPLRSFLADKIDCVISSPPYATALPYIDTQRLSIALLGMANAARIRSLDSELVGSREIANSERLTLEGEMEEHGNGLPTSVSKFCRKLLRAVDLDPISSKTTNALKAFMKAVEFGRVRSTLSTCTLAKDYSTPTVRSVRVAPFDKEGIKLSVRCLQMPSFQVYQEELNRLRQRLERHEFNEVEQLLMSLDIEPIILL